MFCKRIAQVFLLSTGICVLGAGCSAVNALVSSSPAGSGATRKAPERYAAIGRVFENQGRYAQAQAMYRQALKAEPGNRVVKERLEMLALRTKKSGSTLEKKTAEAIALADQVETADRPADRVQPDAAAKSKSSATEVADKAVAAVEVELAGTPTMDVPAETQPTAESTSDADASAEPLIQPAAEPARVEVAETDSEPLKTTVDPAAGLVEIAWSDLAADPAPEKLIFAPGLAAKTESVQQVSFGQSTEAAAGRVVTLADAIQLMETPQSHREQLLETLRYGEDQGVKALAASALSSFPADDEVDNELRQAAASDSAILQLSAVESLIERGQFEDSQFDALLELLTVDAPELRVQAAVVIRNLANSDWATDGADAVAALLNDPDPNVVSVAAASLGDFGEAGTPYRNQLEQLVRNAIDEEVATAAANSLNRLPAADVSATVSFETPEPEPQDSADAQLPGQLLPIVE